MFKFSKRIYLTIIGLILFLAAVHSQLLAIDFGTQYIKASIVHSGAGKSFSIVENSKSERKFTNALGFYNEERFYQTDALPKRTRFPENCFVYSRMLIDLFDKPSLVSVVKKDLFLEYINETNENQFLAEFILKNFPEQTKHVTLLEVMTMILKYVKTEAEKFAKTPIKDVVLVLPNYWNIYQRNFLLQAAAVAEIHVLSIVSQNTAASINYALSQRNQNKTQNVLFYNLGSNSLQMTLVEYKQQIIEGSSKPIQSIFIKDDFSKPYVGGLKFDAIICKYFSELFEQKYKKPLDRKGLIKLLQQSNEVKQTLTANKQATVFVEGIMDGIDFSAKITRAEFQKRAEETLKELTTPLKRFLLDNDIKVEDLHSVELIGGGSRIPKLHSMISEILGDKKQKIGTHINGDQAMALGGAFFAANSSKKFKVKGINLYDGFNFQIRLVLRNLNPNIQQDDQNYFYKNATIFKKKSRYGLNKQVNFKCDQNIKADLYHIDDEGNEQLIKSYEFDQIQKINQSDYKLSLTFSIDPLEIVILKDSKYNFKKDQLQTYLEKVKKIKPKNQTKNEQLHNNQTVEDQDQNNNEKLNQNQTIQEQVNESDDQQTQKQQNKTQNQQNKEQKDKPTKKSKKNKKQKEQVDYQTIEKNKTVTKKYQKNLYSKQVFSHHKKQQQTLNKRTKQLLKTYQINQQKKRILAESKNKLEALIYEVKDKLQNEEFIRYSKQSQRQHLTSQSQSKQQWHDETNSKNPNDYKEHYNELYRPLQKVKRRIIEHYEREHIKNRALETINEYKNLSGKVQMNKQWITDEEVAQLQENILEAEKKIQQIYKSMEETPIDEDCLFKNKQMIRQAQNVKDKYFELKAKPKPTKKETKSEKQNKKSKQEEKKQSDSSNGVDEDQL